MSELEQKSKSNFVIEFMRILEKLIEKPPYLMFYFVSSVLLIVSLIRREDYFYYFLILLLYSMVGVIWRHATKDFGGRLEERYPNKSKNINFWRAAIYQLINIILVIILVILLFSFWNCKI